MVDEARQFRTNLTNGSVAAGDSGLAGLVEAGDYAMLTNDPRTAMQNYTSAVAISPDDGKLWINLAKATLAVQPANGGEGVEPAARRHLGGMERLSAAAHHREPRRGAGRHRAKASTAATSTARRCRPTRQAWRW